VVGIVFGRGLVENTKRGKKCADVNSTGLFQMIVVEAGHAHVMKCLPLSCELLIFVAVTVIF
jgi:hypothetical protein